MKAAHEIIVPVLRGWKHFAITYLEHQNNARGINKMAHRIGAHNVA